jgi:hypothetical protein
MRKIANESIVIFVIGVVDLMSTIYVLIKADASEGNPLFASVLSTGLGWFIAAKLVFGLVGPIVLLELGFRKEPVFTRILARAAIVAYTLMYVTGVIALNC